MEVLKDKLKGNWDQIKGSLKQKWAELTDDELLYEEGKEDEFIGKIQQKTGETKEAINNFIEKLEF